MSDPQMIREPAWVTSLVDQKVAAIVARTDVELLAEFGVVLSPLVEAPPGADLERWERTCDNCGAYVPQGTQFNAGVLARVAHGKQVILSYGACQTCLPLP